MSKRAFHIGDKVKVIHKHPFLNNKTGFIRLIQPGTGRYIVSGKELFGAFKASELEPYKETRGRKKVKECTCVFDWDLSKRIDKGICPIHDVTPPEKKECNCDCHIDFPNVSRKIMGIFI